MQTIANNQRVLFTSKDLGTDIDIFDDEEVSTIATAHDREECTVLYMVNATEEGERDFEYYTIRFDNGDEIYGCSGYMLEDL